LPIPGKGFGIRAARLRDFGCDLSKIEKPPSQRSRPDGLERFPVKKSAPLMLSKPSAPESETFG